MSILTTRKVRNMDIETKKRKFDVTIKIQLSQTTSDVVEAKSEEHAKEIAEQKYWDDVYADELRNSSETDREDYYAQEVIEVMKCPVCEQVYEEFLPQEIHSTDDISERSVNVFFKRVKDYLGATNKA